MTNFKRKQYYMYDRTAYWYILRYEYEKYDRYFFTVIKPSLDGLSYAVGDKFCVNKQSSTFKYFHFISEEDVAMELL